jgi:hypothetical protein
MADFARVRRDLTGVRATLAYATSVKSAGVATFVINGIEVSCQVARDLTVAVGDVCLVQRFGSEWFVVQRYYTAAPAVPLDNPAPPPPKPTSVSGRLVVSPVETRSYRSTVFVGWRFDNDDVYQGQYGGNGLHRGCAFYGTKPRSLVGATVTSATIRVGRKSAGGITAAQSTTLWLVTQSKRPAGAPTLTSSTTGPRLKWGQIANFTIPTSWGQALVDGTAGGLALFDSSGSPYVIFAGRSSLSSAFTLTLNWTRST